MPSANTTIDARDALGMVIHQRYKTDISGGQWSTMSPADPPQKGLGSDSVDDWHITLVRAANAMTLKHYTMAPISLTEAEAKRKEKLDDSVALLVAKASTRTLLAPKPPIPNVALVLGGAAIVAILIALAVRMRRARRNRPQ